MLRGDRVRKSGAEKSPATMTIFTTVSRLEAIETELLKGNPYAAMTAVALALREAREQQAEYEAAMEEQAQAAEAMAVLGPDIWGAGEEVIPF